MEDRKEKGMNGLQKIDASYSYMKSERDEYKNIYIEAEKQIHLLEEKLQQNPDSNQEIQIPIEATTTINSDTNKPSTWDDPVFYIITIAGGFLKEFKKAFKPKEMIGIQPVSDQSVLSNKKNHPLKKMMIRKQTMIQVQ
jgi:hypothetical protein